MIVRGSCSVLFRRVCGQKKDAEEMGKESFGCYNNKKIYSTSFVSGFKNLQELDKEWENFNRALGGEAKSGK